MIFDHNLLLATYFNYYRQNITITFINIYIVENLEKPPVIPDKETESDGTKKTACFKKPASDDDDGDDDIVMIFW